VHAHPLWLIKLHARKSWRLFSAATSPALVLTFSCFCIWV
jgi:hypothetical protein